MHWTESPGDLRRFALTMAAAFGLYGSFSLWRGHGFGVYLLTASGVFLLFGLVWPPALRPVQKAWMTAALIIGWVMSRLILSAVFFLILTPIGILLRLKGKDLLDMKPVARRDSYWSPHRQCETKDYENQF